MEFREEAVYDAGKKSKVRHAEKTPLQCMLPSRNAQRVEFFMFMDNLLIGAHNELFFKSV